MAPNRLIARVLAIAASVAWLSHLLIEPAESSQPNEPGPLWLHEAGADDLPVMSAKLDELLTKRPGPNMRASSDYRDFQDVHLAESMEAWRLLHERAGAFAQQQARLYQPQLERLLQRANVSAPCGSSAGRFFQSIGQLDTWAVQMWSASGSMPPAGIFDGHLTDPGSYRGCIDIRRPDGGEFAASYCMLGFRPVVPSRPRFHQIFELESANLTGLFPPGDILGQLARNAQYFHYLYLRAAICAPAECSARDLQRVATLVGRRLALMAAPVKCISQARAAAQMAANENSAASTAPLVIDLNRKLNATQWAALMLISGFFSIVFLVSAWHGAELALGLLFSSAHLRAAAGDDQLGGGAEELKFGQTTAEQEHGTSNGKSSLALNISQQQQQQSRAELATGFKRGCFHYFSIITNGREFLDTRVRSSEILCLHGFRVLTMFWVVCVHTLQYNDWAGFSRVFENVATLRNPFVQPLINANYAVDNFFLMSGLLAAYTIWLANKGAGPSGFSAARCLLGRYLRLTPQVLLVSLAYVLLPSTGHGPFWYDMTQRSGEQCERNWWVNLLHLQAFYREQEMCNMVGWWISVDMFYYLLALGLLWLVFRGRLQMALAATALFLATCTLITGWRHLAGRFSPNNLGSVPQIGEVWSEFVVGFYWSPYPHAFVFFLGLWLGYALANRLAYHFVRRWARLGWLLAPASLLAVNYSTRLWIAGHLSLADTPQLVSTLHHLVCVIVWACAFGWIIVACHYNCAPALNRLLSTGATIMLSRASFIIYLSHMLILRAFFGSQYNLLEVSLTSLLLLLVGLCFLSILLGVFLCVAFEGPCMKFQRSLMARLERRHHHQRQLPIANSDHLYEEGLQFKEAGAPSGALATLVKAGGSQSGAPKG